MATTLLYMEDFDVTTCDAQVVSVTDTEDGRKAVVLDQTCFYPRGGGQDWDMGTIKSSGGELAVEEVRLAEDGSVHHIGAFVSGEFATGDAVNCAVDVERRNINTRLHSAGHVVDLAVNRLGYDWVPGKGSHYPHMSSVEYTGEFDPAQAEDIRARIEQAAREAVEKGGNNEIRFMDVADMHTVCRHVPPNIPTNKPARVVIYCGDFGVPCGGTHVRNLADIGQISVPKVKSKQGIIKVNYTVQGIN